MQKGPNRGWSLCQKEWADLAERLNNPNNWRKVRFLRDDRVAVPTVPGVYVVCAVPFPRSLNDPHSENDLFSRLYNAVYTGVATKSIKDRFDAHTGSSPSPDMKNARECFSSQLEFWFYTCTNCTDAELNTLEERLQDCLGPRVNANQKGGSGSRVTLGDPQPAFHINE